MKTFHKTMVAIALMTLTAGSSWAETSTTTTTNSDPNKKVIADFSNKLLLIPCVEVTGSSFDGYYNVLMEVTSLDNFLSWKVKQTTPAKADECGDSPSDNTSTDSLLKSMGMPSVGDLIKGVNTPPKDASSSSTTPSTNPQTSTIKNTVESAINDALQGLGGNTTK